MSKSLLKVSNDLFKKEGPKDLPQKRSTSDLKSQWQKSIDDLDFDLVYQLDEAMQSYVTEFVLDRVETKEPRLLEESEVNTLAKEYKSLDLIMKSLEARKAQMRTMVFNHINIDNEDVNHLDPVEQVPGEVVSKEEGLTFKREGGTKKDPSLDPEVLKEILGEKASEVFEEVVIPETVEEKFNEDKFLALVDEGTISLEEVREALIDNGYNTPRFNVRKVSKK